MSYPFNFRKTFSGNSSLSPHSFLPSFPLPLPHLKEGNMTTPPVGNAIAPHRDWKRTEFFLNHEALQQSMSKNIFVVDHYHNKFQDVMHARQNQCKLLCRAGSVYYWFMLVYPLSRSLSGTIAEVTNEENSAIRVEIPDIVSVSSCADLTLPPGAGLCIDTTYGPIFCIVCSSFQVSDLWESLDGWLDAIHLVYTIYARVRIHSIILVISLEATAANVRSAFFVFFCAK
ncbi:hypothetical protein ES288_D01G115500v1 [Gossypium darwinii]|uniref:Uncharacterized protein n=1 Tax=Gossypium darwinii TaxID=34276 RepID=A0A5D2DNY9_GOSDA|nr:hypothetical protein ES288_D01G115500v1 [Gossypium darwinii]